MTGRAMEGLTFYFDWEVRLQEGLQSILGTPGTYLSIGCTMLGEQIVLILLLGFLYWCYDKEFGKFVGINTIMGVILNPMLKNLVLRRRPYFDHSSIKILKPVDPSADIYDISAQGYSFPSGHSTNSVILYGSLAQYGRKKVLMVIAVLFPFLVGVSRVALGAHYVTDVLCGWIMGGLILLGLTLLRAKVKEEKWFYLILILLSLPGVFYCKTEDYFTGLGLLMGFAAALLFEERYVNFRSTRSVPKCIARVLGGGVLYAALNTLLKLPFPKEFLESPTLPAFLVRTARYGVILFLLMGVYPLCFDRWKWGDKE